MAGGACTGSLGTGKLLHVRARGYSSGAARVRTLSQSQEQPLGQGTNLSPTLPFPRSASRLRQEL